LGWIINAATFLFLWGFLAVFLYVSKGIYPWRLIWLDLSKFKLSDGAERGLIGPQLLSGFVLYLPTVLAFWSVGLWLILRGNSVGVLLLGFTPPPTVGLITMVRIFLRQRGLDRPAGSV
jgi:hypothetical protein